MDNGFYTESELTNMGLKSYGKNVLISRKASIYVPSKIVIGDNVRIDDFCQLVGKIKIGNYVHIGMSSYITGGEEGVIMEDFSGLSSRCAIYAQSDDYSGNYLTNPTVPSEYTNVTNKQVMLNKHVIVGTGSTILPGVNIGEGVAVGAMSLVSKSLNAWGIYAGIPCKFVKERSRKLLSLEKEMERK